MRGNEISIPTTIRHFRRRIWSWHEVARRFKIDNTCRNTYPQFIPIDGKKTCEWIYEKCATIQCVARFLFLTSEGEIVSFNRLHCFVLSLPTTQSKHWPHRHRCLAHAAHPPPLDGDSSKKNTSRKNRPDDRS